MGSLAGATVRGRRRRRRSPSEHRRAVIPVGGEGRRAAATPNSDDILPSHADQQGGALGRRQEISDKTPTCKTATGEEHAVGDVVRGRRQTVGHEEQSAPYPPTDGRNTFRHDFSTQSHRIRAEMEIHRHSNSPRAPGAESNIKKGRLWLSD